MSNNFKFGQQLRVLDDGRYTGETVLYVDEDFTGNPVCVTTDRLMVWSKNLEVVDDVWHKASEKPVEGGVDIEYLLDLCGNYAIATWGHDTQRFTNVDSGQCYLITDINAWRRIYPA